MLPAPTTTASSTPRACTPAIWAAIAATRSGSVPCSRRPMSASPDSFRSTRLNTGLGRAPSSATAAPLFLADGEAHEAPDHDVLAGARREPGPQLLDRLAVVLVAVDVR